MKKLIFVMWIYFAISVKVSGQCPISEMFPFKLSINPYEAIKIVNEAGLCYSNIETYGGGNGWKRHSYLKADSVYIKQICYSISCPCFAQDSSAVVWLTFADERLYVVRYKLYFKASEYSKAIAQYHQLIDSMGAFYTYRKASTI